MPSESSGRLFSDIDKSAQSILYNLQRQPGSLPNIEAAPMPLAHQPQVFPCRRAEVVVEAMGNDSRCEEAHSTCDPPCRQGYIPSLEPVRGLLAATESWMGAQDLE